LTAVLRIAVRSTTLRLNAGKVIAVRSQNRNRASPQPKAGKRIGKVETSNCGWKTFSPESNFELESTIPSFIKTELRRKSMLNILVVPVLLANVVVMFYLKPWALVANYVGLKRGERQINAFRVAGLL
jgi:hypothetical protein